MWEDVAKHFPEAGPTWDAMWVRLGIDPPAVSLMMGGGTVYATLVDENTHWPPIPYWIFSFLADGQPGWLECTR